MARREEVLPAVLSDLKARVAKGAKQYGERLTTHNGRDALLDAYEEALDLALYLKQAILERPLPAYVPKIGDKVRYADGDEPVLLVARLGLGGAVYYFTLTGQYAQDPKRDPEPTRSCDPSGLIYVGESTPDERLLWKLPPA